MLHSTLIHNIPISLANTKRFFYNMISSNRKIPTLDGITPCAWKDTSNQYILSDLEINDKTPYIGMITTDLIFFDFDHIINPQNKTFTSIEAKYWFNWLYKELNSPYCEYSVSGTGIHIFAKKDNITFTDKKIITLDNGGKLEIYANDQQCLLTGDILECSTNNIPNITQSIIDTFNFRQNIIEDTPLSIDFDDESKCKIALMNLPCKLLPEPVWFNCLQIAYNSNVSFEFINDWCKNDINRYDYNELSNQWEYIKKRECSNPIRLGSLILLLKHYNIKCDFFSHKNLSIRYGDAFNYLQSIMKPPYTTIPNTKLITKALGIILLFDSSSLIYEEYKQWYKIYLKNIKQLLNEIKKKESFSKHLLYEFGKIVPSLGEGNPSNEDISTLSKLYNSSPIPQSTINKEIKSLEEQRKISFINAMSCNTTQQAISTCPINVPIPENYFLNENGIFYQTSKNKLIKIIETPIVLTKIILSDNNLQYEGAFLIEENWKYFYIQASKLFTANGIISLSTYGVPVGSDNATLLITYLRKFSIIPGIPKQQYYEYPGWYNENTFIYPDESNFNLLSEPNYYSKLFSIKGDKSAWIKQFEVISDISPIAKLVLGVSLVAPLIKVLNIMNVQLHLEGSPSIGKSVLVKFAISIYGNPIEWKTSFSATHKNQLLNAMLLRDFPSFIDEIESLNKKQEKYLQDVIYEFEISLLNQANTNDGKAREKQHFTGSRISTGEHPIIDNTSKRGLYKRIMNVYAESLFTEDIGSYLHRFTSQHYGLYGKIWIDYIQNNKQTIINDFISYKFPDCVNNQDKSILTALLASLLAYEHFKVAVSLSKTININNLTNNLIELQNTLPYTQELDESNRALLNLKSWVKANSNKFISNTSTNVSNIELAGVIIDENKVAFFPYMLKNILENILGYSSCSALLKTWKKKQLIYSEPEKLQVKVKYDGSFIRMNVFKPDVLI